MLIYKSYKTELNPTKEQEVLFEKAVGIARFVYNWALEQRIKEYKESGKQLTEFEQHKILNSLKKNEFPWMYEVSKSVAQHSLNNLDVAYKNFFKNIKNGKKIGFPKFKSKHTEKETFYLEYPIRVLGGKIQLPRIGVVNLKEINYIPSEKDVKILSAVVSKHAGRWFIAVKVQQEIPDYAPCGETIGIDLGIKDMAVLSDGRVFTNHKALPKRQKKLARLQRRLAKKVKGSANRAKAKLKLSKLFFKISCIRGDSIHRFTSEVLARTKPAQDRPCKIVIEDLNVQGMVKNHCLARSLSNVAFGEIRRQLEYKCRWYGVELVLADRFYPSSKTCSNCGHIYKELQLSEREWNCRECGTLHSRDLNAAINLKNYQPKNTANLAGINACGDQVRPVKKYKLSSGLGRGNKNQKACK